MLWTRRSESAKARDLAEARARKLIGRSRIRLPDEGGCGKRLPI